MEPIAQLLLFSFGVGAVIAATLIICKLNIKEQKAKNLVFAIAAILGVLIHYSSVVYHLIADGTWEIENNMYLPVYPCNIIMWLNLVLVFVPKKSKGFSIIGEFVFLCGTLCTSVGMFANINFLNNPDFSNFDIVKGLVSHAVEIFACVYLGVMGYVKIKAIHSTISCALGCVLFLICGGISILVETLMQVDPANSMFLLEPPIPEAPFLNIFVIMIISLVVMFGLLTLFERIAYPKENRWYNKLKKN